MCLPILILQFKEESDTNKINLKMTANMMLMFKTWPLFVVAELGRKNANVKRAEILYPVLITNPKGAVVTLHQ